MATLRLVELEFRFLESLLFDGYKNGKVVWQHFLENRSFSTIMLTFPSAAKVKFQ